MNPPGHGSAISDLVHLLKRVGMYRVHVVQIIEKMVCEGGSNGWGVGKVGG